MNSAQCCGRWLMSDLDKFQTIHAANKFPSAGTEPSLGPGCDQIQHHRTSKKHKRRTLCLFFFSFFFWLRLLRGRVWHATAEIKTSVLLRWCNLFIPSVGWSHMNSELIGRENHFTSSGGGEKKPLTSVRVILDSYRVCRSRYWNCIIIEWNSR